MFLPFRPLAALFDLDGTLVDSRDDIAAACNHALVAQGRLPLDAEVVRRFVGDGARKLLVRAFDVADDDSHQLQIEQALSDFRAFYEAHPTDHTSILPGVQDIVAALGPIAKLGIVTNKPRPVSELVIAQLGLSSAFGLLRAGGDGPLKPDPWPIVDALGALGVSPSDAWMVGDGPQDIGAGRAAGCFTIAVRAGFGTDEALAMAKPDLIVDSLGALAALLRHFDETQACS